MSHIVSLEARAVSPAAGSELLDRAARHYLDMSGQEFEEAWCAGSFDDDPDRPEVMAVAMLLPFGK